MSDQSDAEPIELHIFSPSQEHGIVEILTAVAHYHLTGAYLGLGHTVNFGRPWIHDSKCDHGLISLPYLDGPELEWCRIGERDVRFLWLVPVTMDEVEFKKRFGLESLEELFEEKQFDYLDWSRQSVVV